MNSEMECNFHSKLITTLKMCFYIEFRVLFANKEQEFIFPNDSEHRNRINSRIDYPFNRLFPNMKINSHYFLFSNKLNLHFDVTIFSESHES